LAIAMSFATQANSLAALGATMRREVFGINPVGTTQKGRMADDANTTHTFDCYFSPVRSQEQLDAAMFKDVHDTILRVDKTAQYFDPTVGKNVILVAAKNDNSNLTLRISEIGITGVNPEYVVGCKAVF
jgi:hypothetical protein